MTLYFIGPLSVGNFVYTIFSPNLIKFKFTYYLFQCISPNHQLPPNHQGHLAHWLSCYLWNIWHCRSPALNGIFFSLSTMTGRHAVSFPSSSLAPSLIPAFPPHPQWNLRLQTSSLSLLLVSPDPFWLIPPHSTNIKLLSSPYVICYLLPHCDSSFTLTHFWNIRCMPLTEFLDIYVLMAYLHLQQGTVVNMQIKIT